MFCAPMLTNGDIGSDGSPESPVFVVDEGSPHALMIVAVPDSADARQPVDPGPAPDEPIVLEAKTSGWVGTGIAIAQGDVVEIAASGLACALNDPALMHGPTGGGAAPNSSFLVQGLPVAGLIAGAARAEVVPATPRASRAGARWAAVDRARTPAQ